MYDPKIGQWLSQDPTDFDALDPNLRRYVGNHPTMATDPLGLWEEPPGPAFSLKPIKGPNITFTAEEIKAAKDKWGSPKYITIDVMVTQYYYAWKLGQGWKQGLIDTAKFYQKYGIYITWNVYDVQQKTWVESQYCSGSDSYNFYDVWAAEEYLRTVDLMNVGASDQASNLPEKELEWYKKNFSKKPTVVFIGDIDYWGPGSWTSLNQVLGFQEDNFVFASGPWPWELEPGELLSHEIGHLLGYQRHDDFGVMASGSMTSLQTETQNDSTIRTIRNSDLLSNSGPTTGVKVQK
ncbi:MAG: hypothetical protein ACKVP0_19200 [Pirellulaceae bacterium]